MAAIHTRTLDCGLPLVIETIPGVRSAGLTWLLPAGSARDPDDKQGLCAMASELLLRGAGDLDSRQQADAFDRLGASRHAEVGTMHLSITCTCLGARLHDVLPLLTDTIRRPRFDENAIEPVRDLCLQSLDALEDDPADRVMLLAKQFHAPAPINRSGMGEREHLERLTRDDLVSAWRHGAVPRGSILGIAGAVDPDAVTKRLNELLAGWEGAAPDLAWSGDAPRGYHHITDDTSQVQVTLMHDSPPEHEPDAMLERIATSALSGGMSGRLFTEVREKRGLCYSVSASYLTDREYARTVAYVGTTPQRAQESLDVLVAELQRLHDPAGRLTQSEYDRAVVGMKSRLVMSGESTGARASALARDLHRVGRPRSLDELARDIDGCTLAKVNDYLARRDLGRMTICTLGPEALTPPAGV
jgi:predicted Zn-dependent peptidase